MRTLLYATIFSAGINLNVGNAIAETKNNVYDIMKNFSYPEFVLDQKLNNFISSGYDCRSINVNDFLYEGNLIDAEGLLGPEQEKILEDIISSFKIKKGIKILFISKEGINDMNLFGTNIGQCLGVGEKGVDNGLVILLDMKNRKSFISTGYGLEGVLTDAEVRRITDLGTPFFKEKNTAGGINAILNGIDKYFTKEEISEVKELKVEIIKKLNEKGILKKIEGGFLNLSPMEFSILIFSILCIIIFLIKKAIDKSTRTSYDTYESISNRVLYGHKSPKTDNYSGGHKSPKTDNYSGGYESPKSNNYSGSHESPKSDNYSGGGFGGGGAGSNW